MPRKRTSPTNAKEAAPYCPDEKCGRRLRAHDSIPGALVCGRCGHRYKDLPKYYRTPGAGGRKTIGGHIPRQPIGTERLAYIEQRIANEGGALSEWVRHYIALGIDVEKGQVEGYVDAHSWGPEHDDVIMELLHSNEPVTVDDLLQVLDVAPLLRVVCDLARARLAEPTENDTVEVIYRGGLRAAASDLAERLTEPEETHV